MNETLKQLAEQAGEEVVSTDYEVVMHTASEDGAELKVPAVFIEKYAELITQDAIDYLELHSTCFDGDVGRGVKTAVRLLKEHYAV
jgi:hypothetical protein